MTWSHFYGTVEGKAGEASRLGTEASGLQVSACSKQGRIDVRLESNRFTGNDTYYVSMKRHGSSTGWEGVLARGDMGNEPIDKQVGVLPTPTIESFEDEAIVAEVKRRFGFDLVLRQPNPPTR